MKSLYLVAAALCLVLIAAPIAAAQALSPTVMSPDKVAITKPLRDVAPATGPDLWWTNYHRPLPQRSPSPGLPDTALQTTSGPLINATGGTHFDGIGANGHAPPDANMAVGQNPSYNYILQTVNSRFAVFTKSGGLI